jgi:hypothetical protein
MMSLSGSGNTGRSQIHHGPNAREHQPKRPRCRQGEGSTVSRLHGQDSGRRVLLAVSFRMSAITWLNSVGSNGFGMKAMHPARLNSFATSAVAEVRATTGIRLIAGSAFSRRTTSRPFIPPGIALVEQDQINVDGAHHIQRRVTARRLEDRVAEALE